MGFWEKVVRTEEWDDHRIGNSVVIQLEVL